VLPSFYSWTEPVARKEYACCECAAKIHKGEKHFHATGKWDGVVSTYRQHLACCEACILIRDEFNGGDCIGFGEMKDAFGGMRADETYFCFKEKWKEPWKRLRSLMAQILWRERKDSSL
jgi:hypothetical protein